jgi:hypothetical protein
LVNAWKVILATLVIYSAGLVTGGLLVRQGAPPFRRPPPPPGPGLQQALPPILQQRFLERMKVELALTSDQYQRLERLFAESRERTRIIMDLVRPELQGEVRAMREKIMAELTPEQRRQFEDFMRRGRPPGEGPGPLRRGPFRDFGGGPMSNPPPAK